MAKVKNKTTRTIYLSDNVDKMLNDYAYEHYHKQGKSPNYSEIIEEALNEYLDPCGQPYCSDETARQYKERMKKYIKDKE